MNMDFEQARFNMVEQQIRTWDVLDTDVLDVMMAVKREDFVPPAHRALAFAEIEVPLGHGQTMLYPVIEGRLLQALAPRRADKVLEIGAGSGYMAALIGARAGQVLSVEIQPELAQMARANLARAGVANVQVEVGDAARGWAAGAPYDAIMVSGALPMLPKSLLEQLKVGGRLVAIVGTEPAMTAKLVTRTAQDAWQTENLFETKAAPLANAEQPAKFSF